MFTMPILGSLSIGQCVCDAFSPTTWPAMSGAISAATLGWITRGIVDSRGHQSHLTIPWSTLSPPGHLMTSITSSSRGCCEIASSSSSENGRGMGLLKPQQRKPSSPGHVNSRRRRGQYLLFCPSWNYPNSSFLKKKSKNWRN